MISASTSEKRNIVVKRTTAGPELKGVAALIVCEGTI